jgi:hypothetical protein
MAMNPHKVYIFGDTVIITLKAKHWKIKAQ